MYCLCLMLFYVSVPPCCTGDPLGSHSLVSAHSSSFFLIYCTLFPSASSFCRLFRVLTILYSGHNYFYSFKGDFSSRALKSYLYYSYCVELFLQSNHLSHIDIEQDTNFSRIYSYACERMCHYIHLGGPGLLFLFLHLLAVRCQYSRHFEPHLCPGNLETLAAAVMVVAKVARWRSSWVCGKYYLAEISRTF